MKNDPKGIGESNKNALCCAVTSSAKCDPAELLNSVVAELCAASSGERHIGIKGAKQQALPSRDAIVEIVQALRTVLFPGYFGASEVARDNISFHVGATLDHVIRALQEQIRRGLCFACGVDTPDLCAQCEVQALDQAHAFLKELPAIQWLLQKDAVASFEGDPAATSSDEAIFCYPGLLAIINYRIAHELNKLDVPLIPRIMTEHAHSITGIDIHPGAQIGEAFFIDHGTGVVIGETTVIGKGVRLYQGVTLGAKSMPTDEEGNLIKGIPRHPVVEDDVVIYSGATILGRVTIGKGSVIGGNVWLTRSVLPGSRITQAQVRQDHFEQGGGI